MGLFESIKNILIIPDEDEFDEDTVQQEEVQPKKKVSEPAPAPKRTESAPRIYQGGRGRNVAAASDDVKIVLIKLERYDQTSEVADKILEKKTVVLNLEETDGMNSRRILDFLTGAVYAIHGDIKKVANSTYVVAPSGVDLSGDTLWDELRDNQNYY